MRPVLFDTSVYITALRMEEEAALRLRRIAGGGPMWLSAVVLEELYAGANANGRRAVERLERISKLFPHEEEKTEKLRTLYNKLQIYKAEEHGAAVQPAG